MGSIKCWRMSRASKFGSHLLCSTLCRSVSTKHRKMAYTAMDENIHYGEMHIIKMFFTHMPLRPVKLSPVNTATRLRFYTQCTVIVRARDIFEVSAGWGTVQGFWGRVGRSSCATWQLGYPDQVYEQQGAESTGERGCTQRAHRWIHQCETVPWLAFWVKGSWAPPWAWGWKHCLKAASGFHLLPF